MNTIAEESLKSKAKEGEEERGKEGKEEKKEVVQENRQKNSKQQKQECNEEHKSKLLHFFTRMRTVCNEHQVAIPRWLYIVFFVLNDIAIVTILQLGVQAGAKKQAFLALYENLVRMVSNMWTVLSFVFLLNVLIVARSVNNLRLLLITSNHFFHRTFAIISRLRHHFWIYLSHKSY